MASSPMVRWLLTLAFIALVVVLSVTPGKPRSGDSFFIWLVATTPTLLQKSMHVAVYAMLAALWMWTLEDIVSPVLRSTLAFTLTLTLGVILEWLQTMVPGRFGTLFDVFLDTIGAFIGLLAALLIL